MTSSDPDNRILPARVTSEAAALTRHSPFFASVGRIAWSPERPRPKFPKFEIPFYTLCIGFGLAILTGEKHISFLKSAAYQRQAMVRDRLEELFDVQTQMLQQEEKVFSQKAGSRTAESERFKPNQ